MRPAAFSIATSSAGQYVAWADNRSGTFRIYVAEHTAASEAYASFQNLEVHAVGSLLEWLDEPPTKLVAVGDPDELDLLEDRLAEHFDGRMYISKSLPYFLEFAAPNVTKAAGLEFVAERLGFDRAQTVSFGDGENDIEIGRASCRERV